MANLLRARLSGMMFLQYVVPGSVWPILSLYLKDQLGFEPRQVGLVMALPALAALFAPALVARFADRYIGAERFLALCHLAAGALMFVLAEQTQFLPFLLLYFVYSMMYVPTAALSNTVAFHHVLDRNREFSGIRMWGTIGWVVVAWAFSFLWLQGHSPDSAQSRLVDALRCSGLASVLLGVYALTLPRSPVFSTAGKLRVGPWDGLKLFKRRSLMLLCVASLLNGFVSQFYYFAMGPYLTDAGFSSRHVMPTMSVGQISEVAFMAMLPFFMRRMSIKRLLILGVLAQCVRYTVFAFLPSAPFILGGIALHGVGYTFFTITAVIYLDTHSAPAERAGAQQFYNVIVTGLANLGGYLIAGEAARVFTEPGTSAINFQSLWLVPTVVGLFTATVLALSFREESPAAEPAQAAVRT